MALHRNASPTLAERRRVIVVLDLAGFTRAVGGLGALELARLVDDFYAVVDAAVVGHGGRVVKFVGDGCLALFAADDVEGALGCVDAVADGLPALNRMHGVGLEQQRALILGGQAESPVAQHQAQAHASLLSPVVRVGQRGASYGDHR